MTRLEELERELGEAWIAYQTERLLSDIRSGKVTVVETTTRRPVGITLYEV